MLRSSLAIALVGLAATALDAQEPTLRSVSEHLEQGAEDPVGTRRFAARRCSALFSLISVQMGDRGDRATAEMYANWVIGFGVVATMAGMELGSTRAEARRENESAVDEIGEVLKQRMNRNMAFSRSYYMNDPLLSSDVRTCRDLVDEFRLNDA